MPTGIPIKFSDDQATGLEEMAGAVPLSANTLKDASGAVRKRPGLVQWSDFPTPSVASEIQAMAIFGEYVVYVTADRKIHAWLASGLVQELSDGTAATQLDSDQRPVITITKTRCIITGGGAIQYWDGVSALSARLPGSPPICTHAVAANTRLVVNPRGNTGQVAWSEAGELLGQLDWTHGNFLELESFPDPCVALYQSQGELVGMGTKSIQILNADPVAGYVSARTLEIGTLSPYSFVSDEDDWSFFDSTKRFVSSDGRSTKKISSPGLTRTLKTLQTIDDCWSFNLMQDAWDLRIWVFPTEKKCYVWNKEGTSWSEWRGRSQSDWDKLPISAYCFFPQQSLHLVGCQDGKIKILDFNAATDDGSILHAEMNSGFIDHSTKKLKICEGVRLTFRTTPGTIPRARLWWRDDQGAWFDYVDFDVDERNIVEIRTLGQYRTREWKLELDDQTPMSLVAAEEDFTLLEM